jgi:hemoglobin-like flavoprotein
MDTEALQRTWQTITQLGDRVPLRFYTVLFYHHPEVQPMFPPGMANQRDKLMAALGEAISNIDHLDELRPTLRKLGRDHRRFGATQAHYGAVLEALLETFSYCINEWTQEQWTEADTDTWAMAYEEIAQVMIEAAYEQHLAGVPAWWDVPVIESIRHRNYALLRIESEGAPPGYRLRPGRVIDLLPPRRPGLWTNAIVTEAGSAGVILRIRHRGLDFPAMALASLGPGDLVRIGPPEPFEPPEEPA